MSSLELQPGDLVEWNEAGVVTKIENERIWVRSGEETHCFSYLAAADVRLRRARPVTGDEAEAIRRGR